MTECRRQLERGKHELSRHNPEAAVKAFEAALNACPLEKRRELARVFYYLGLTLLRLGRPSGAVRSFRAASRLRKRSCYSRKMLGRFANEYGMTRQSTREKDDWRAFYSIHLQRYLKTKHTGRIVTDAEGDMIRDLIHDYWKRLCDTGALNGRCAQEKLSLFRSIEIVFPIYVVHTDLPNEKVIPVDFLSKRRILDAERCSCGSGIPFMMCCGRTRGVEELTPGAF